MRLIFCGLILMLAANFHCVAGAEQPDCMPTGFINKTAAWLGQPRQYVVYVPRDYTPDRAWPMILFLHGAGERGDDGLLPTEVGIAAAIRRHPARFPAIVVFPQCPKQLFWDVCVDYLEAAMADTRRDYAIDPARIYLTGLSMGGYMTWAWGAVKSDTFAALMPICGGGKPEDLQSLSEQPIAEIFGTLPERVERLKTLPIWAFHGKDDPVVPVFRSTQMVKILEREGGKPLLTLYDKTGHNCWDQAYGDEAVVAWLLAQRK